MLSILTRRSDTTVNQCMAKSRIYIYSHYSAFQSHFYEKNDASASKKLKREMYSPKEEKSSLTIITEWDLMLVSTLKKM